jgi:hypothetical protein
MNTHPHARYWALASLVLVLFTACHKDISNPLPAATPPTDELVLTPAGYMEKSKVHFIGEGQQLTVSNGRLFRTDIRTGKTLQDFGAVKRTPAILPAPASGWIAYAYWTNSGTAITNFTTKWKVPAVPASKSNQTLFLFNGMQDGTTSTSYIVQPVLQWGPSAAGGGKYWAITNWYVSSSQAFFGSLVTVNPGTNLTGVMKQTAVSGSNYSYNSSFTGYAAASALQINNVPQAFWAAETLEAYGITNVSTQYPPDAKVALTSIQILKGSTNASISWTAVHATGAVQRAIVVSNSSPGGEVDITFR